MIFFRKKNKDTLTATSLLFEGEFSLLEERGKSFKYIPIKEGIINMEEFGFPYNEFKDMEIIRVKGNNLRMRYKNTFFNISFRNIRTFGTILKKDRLGQTIYGCASVKISLKR